jgi:hypothetical protein
MLLRPACSLVAHSAVCHPLLINMSNIRATPYNFPWPITPAMHSLLGTALHVCKFTRQPATAVKWCLCADSMVDVAACAVPSSATELGSAEQLLSVSLNVLSQSTCLDSAMCAAHQCSSYYNRLGYLLSLVG